ncbi:MAG: glycerophosphodiester phosphodiesterase [SAR202 cluster bacterium]|nr:glycerophosphodiester phosphodiesterase [SAR202 cluster bacterium]
MTMRSIPSTITSGRFLVFGCIVPKHKLDVSAHMLPERVRVVAHRGASAYAPENTFAAFDKALALGAHEAELDVHLSRDGQVVVIHDATVDRTTGGAGAVASLTLAQLKALDAGTWFSAEFAGQRIPTLDEVLERYRGRLHLHIELKPKIQAVAGRVADLVRSHGMAESVTVISFHRGLIEHLREYAPEIPAGLLVQRADEADARRAVAKGIRAFYARGASLAADSIRHLREQGLAVVAWDVQNEAEMRRLVAVGADGIILDFPDKLVEYLRLTSNKQERAATT